MDVTRALELLDEESAQLDALAAGLSPEDWQRQTPSAGWSVADQIAHLHWTDTVALQAIDRDPAAERTFSEVAAAGDLELVDREAHRLAAQPPQTLLTQWRDGRARLADALRSADPEARIAWFGPPMRPVSMVTARIMETWAHGLDVWDALERPKPVSGALAAVARLGVRTRSFSFAFHGAEAPSAEVSVELELPGHESLEFGPAEAADRITGTAWAFAAVVTQRRNIADVALDARGEAAVAWMAIAQSFAGVPTRGPRPGTRALPGDR